MTFHPIRRDRSRSLEVAVALVGLTMTSLSIVEFFEIGSGEAISEVLFLGAPSAGLLFSNRTDVARAFIFILMAVARLHQPFAHPVLGFQWMSLLCAAAALYCFLRNKLPTSVIKLRAVGQVSCGTAVTVGCVYGLFVAHTRASVSGVVLFSLSALFFGGLTFLRITLGDYWWLNPNRLRKNTK